MALSQGNVGWIQVPVDHTLSDGDKETWPKESNCHRTDDSLYREKVAKMWMVRRNEYENGKNIVFCYFFWFYILPLRFLMFRGVY